MKLLPWTLAIFFGLYETAYFGWNMTPHSDAELMADGVTLLLFSLAFR